MQARIATTIGVSHNRYCGLKTLLVTMNSAVHVSMTHPMPAGVKLRPARQPRHHSVAMSATAATVARLTSSSITVSPGPVISEVMNFVNVICHCPCATDQTTISGSAATDSTCRPRSDW